MWPWYQTSSENIRSIKNHSRICNIILSEFAAIDNDHQELMNILSEHEKYKALHQFIKENVSNHIKHWVLNDINYRKELMDTMTIFFKHLLFINRSYERNGWIWFILIYGNKNYWYNVWQFNNVELKLQSKSAPAIGYMIHSLPV